jgi:hypothetical protein
MAMACPYADSHDMQPCVACGRTIEFDRGVKLDYLDSLTRIVSAMDISAESMKKAEEVIKAWNRYLAERQQTEQSQHDRLIKALARPDFCESRAQWRGNNKRKAVRQSSKNGATWPKPKGSY